jgi:hypothetical protein
MLKEPDQGPMFLDSQTKVRDFLNGIWNVVSTCVCARYIGAVRPSHIGVEQVALCGGPNGCSTLCRFFYSDVP